MNIFQPTPIKPKIFTFTFINDNFDQPVYVDMVTRGVYEIPASQWSKTSNTFTLTNIRVYDAPILIADKSLIKMQ